MCDVKPSLCGNYPYGHDINQNFTIMSRYVECDGLADLESKADELYDEYSNVVFVQWHKDNIAEFFCE